LSKIDRLCDQLGIKIVPYRQRRGRWETNARQTLRKIAAAHGDGHLSIVIKAIKANPDHALELWSETISAISEVLIAFPDLEERGGLLLDQFEAIDLRAMRLRAKGAAIGRATAAMAMTVLLIDALAPATAPVAPGRVEPTLQDARRKRVLAQRREMREAA
jgi:hypothetical protein